MGIDIEACKMEYGQSFNIVRSIVNQYDPIGLIKIGWPEHEYDYQVCRILGGLQNANTTEEIQELVYDAFFDLFDEGAGSREKYRSIAQQIEDWKKQ